MIRSQVDINVDRNAQRLAGAFSKNHHLEIKMGIAIYTQKQ